MEYINSLSAVLAVVFGAGWGVQFIFYKYEKRDRNAKSKSAEIDVDAREDEIRDQKLLRAYDTVVKLQGIVDTEREKWVAISVELSEVKLELAREREARKMAEFGRCDAEGCDFRTPPRSKIIKK